MQVTITLLALGLYLIGRLTCDVVHHVVAPELVHHIVALEFVRAFHAHLVLLQDEGGVVMKIASLVAKGFTKNGTRFDYHFDKIKLRVLFVLKPATAVILLCICRAPVTASYQPGRSTSALESALHRAGHF